MKRAGASLVLAVTAVLAVSACGSDKGDQGAPTPTPTPSASASAGPSVSPTESPTTPASLTTVSVYFLKGEAVQPVPRTVEGKGVAAGAVTWLLTGPMRSEQAGDLTSAVPAGTKLNSVTIAGGLATVDLSKGFESGGGTLSMRARVAEVVFTLTQFPTVNRVAFELDGTPVTSLGGEGVSLARPQTRADYEDLAPAVLVESPRWGADVRSPLRVTGTANTFEAVFFLELRDPRGKVLVTKRVQASSGTGTRGTFDATLTWSTTDRGEATLKTYVMSPKDGSRQDVTTIPVRLVG